MNNSVVARQNVKPLISIIAPFLNEEQAVYAFFQEITPVLKEIDADWEIICVDDGSQDNTLEYLLVAARTNPLIKVLALSRNFGKEAALTAGIESSSGDVVVLIDADLRKPRIHRIIKTRPA